MLQEKGARWFVPERVSEELLLKIHTPRFVGSRRGLTMELFPRLAAAVKACAEKICGGRCLVLTHGGNRAYVARYIFPRIIEILAGKNERSSG